MATTISNQEQDLLEELRELEAGAEGREFDEGEKETWNNLNSTLEQLRTRRERIEELAKNPANCEDGTPFAAMQAVRNEELPPHVRGSREQALRANERATFLSEASREHMERELREDYDPDSRLARYVGDGLVEGRPGGRVGAASCIGRRIG